MGFFSPSLTKLRKCWAFKIPIFACLRLISGCPFEYFGPAVNVTFCFQDDSNKYLNNYIYIYKHSSHCYLKNPKFIEQFCTYQYTIVTCPSTWIKVKFADTNDKFLWKHTELYTKRVDKRITKIITTFKTTHNNNIHACYFSKQNYLFF